MMQSDSIAEVHRLLCMRSVEIIERKMSKFVRTKNTAVKPRKREPENFEQVEGVTNSDNSIETCPTSKQSTDFVQASHVASRDIIIRFGPKDKHALDLSSQPRQVKRFLGLAWLKIAADKSTGIKIPWVAQGKSWKRVRKDITFRFFYDMDQLQTSYVT